MNTQDIVQKLWNLCDVLRDDGITYHQYVTELTYILFLKMLHETGEEDLLQKEIEKEYKKRLEKYALSKGTKVEELTDVEKIGMKTALDSYSWTYLISLKGDKLKSYYNAVLEDLGMISLPIISSIFSKAVSGIGEPKNLEKIIIEIDKLDCFDANRESLGDIYESMLERIAEEKKSGAGQYFTPRVLIDVMTELINPKLGERCFDPACGTFGFMISAYRHVMKKNGLSPCNIASREEFFTGVELVADTYRLALMNAYLHNVPSRIYCEDTLAVKAKRFKDFDVILTNPPFGVKKSGERISRDDISFQTTNKQLNFLQVIYRSLRADNNSRCAIILPDNVLFAGGDGVSVRRELMNLCDLYMVLRLPTGIFYAQGVQTNVLFFVRGKSNKGNTKEVAFYDMRTGMESFGKMNQLKKSDFSEFMEGYKDVSKRKGRRWSKFTRDQIEKEYDDSLDLGLVKSNSVSGSTELIDPIDSGEKAIAQLEESVELLKKVVCELKSLSLEE